MPVCVYPVISFDSVYDESNALGRMMAPREQSEPTDVISVESARKLYNMHSREDNMFICVDRSAIGAEANDIIYAVDSVVYERDNHCYARAFHTVTYDNIQMINVFRDSELNDSKLNYYIFKKSTGKTHHIHLDKTTWRLDGWGSTPVAPMPARTGQACRVQEVVVPSRVSSRVQVPIKTIQRRANNTSNNTITNQIVEQYNPDLLSVTIDPAEYQYDRHITVYLQYRENNGDLTEFSAGKILYAFAASSGSETTTAIECRGVQPVTVTGSGPVHIRIYSNSQFSEHIFFGLGTTTGNNIDINVYQDVKYNAYDHGDSFIVERASMTLDFRNFGAGDWIWWSDPAAVKTGRTSGYISDYFGSDTVNTKWKIIKTQDSIAYRVGGSYYGTPFATFDQNNTMFNIQFESQPDNKRIEYEPSGSLTYQISTNEVTLDTGKYTWLPFNSLENSKVTVAQESFLRTQYNFEQLAAAGQSSFELAPGNGFKIYPTETGFTTAGLTIDANAQVFGSSYGVTIFRNIDAQLYDSSDSIANTQQLHGLTSSGVLGFKVGSMGLVTDIFSNDLTKNGLTNIYSKNDLSALKFNFAASGTGVNKRFIVEGPDYLGSGSGSISFVYNSQSNYNVYPLEMFITSAPIVTYKKAGQLGSAEARFSPLSVSFKVRTRAFILSDKNYITTASADINSLIASNLSAMISITSADRPIRNTSDNSINYGDIVTFFEEQEVTIDLTTQGELVTRLQVSPSYSLTSDSGNFYFKENGTILDLMATNTDLNKFLPGAQEVSIFKLNSAAGTPVYDPVTQLTSLTVIYNGANWVFGTAGPKLYFLYRNGEVLLNVAIFDATNGQTDTSELSAPGLQVKHTTLETGKWRIKGVTNGITYSTSNTSIVFEYSSDFGANWVAAAKLSATL